MDRTALADIYHQLDALETRKIDSVTFRPRTDLSFLPVAVTLVLSLAFQALRLVRLPATMRRVRS
jgi:Ca-activated chloride channel family protein